jgi:hypothetical protein
MASLGVRSIEIEAETSFIEAANRSLEQSPRELSPDPTELVSEGQHDMPAPGGQPATQ